MAGQHGLGTVRGAKQRCVALRALLLESPHLCTPEEVADYWPGGTENKLTGLAGWVYCWGNYCRLWGRDEVQQRGEQAEARQHAIERALASEPERVELDQVDEVGVRLTRSVFQKSFYALMHAMERDIILHHLTVEYRKLDQLGTPTAAELMGRVLEEIGYQHRLLIWLVSEPSSGLPWADDDTRPTPPPWTGDVSAFDVLRFIHAHRRVNGTQLQVVATILGMQGSNSSNDPASWSTIMAVAAKQFSRSSRALMRDEPLVSLVTQLLVTHNEEAKQAAAAERRAQSHQAARAMPPMVG